MPTTLPSRATSTPKVWTRPRRLIRQTRPQSPIALGPHGLEGLSYTWWAQCCAIGVSGRRRAWALRRRASPIAPVGQGGQEHVWPRRCPSTTSIRVPPRATAPWSLPLLLRGVLRGFTRRPASWQTSGQSAPPQASQKPSKFTKTEAPFARVCIGCHIDDCHCPAHTWAESSSA